MIIKMRKGAHLGIIGTAVRKFLDAGCELWDIMIKRNNGEAFIAVFRDSANLLKDRFSNFLFKEGLVWVESYDLDNALFRDSNGEGFEEAWLVLQYPECKH